ncbi:MAG: YigZ family protein [Thermoanaerobacteraceae bacterium]|nr:YigZ family protein [Thermoanaerobacteraceae bacterium]
MGLEPYVSVIYRGESEFIDKKSRFFGHSMRVSCEDEALLFIEEMRNLFRDATHNVFAYKIRGGLMRYSDDGEPSGTAGLPVLDVINNMGIIDVAVVVTRYFGGTLLGRGGLARAYSRATRDSLIQGKIATFTPFYLVRLIFDYSILGRLDNYLNDKVYIKDKIYTDRIEYKFYMQIDKKDRILKDVKEFSAGRCMAEIEDEVYLPVLEGNPII